MRNRLFCLSPLTYMLLSIIAVDHDIKVNISSKIFKKRPRKTRGRPISPKRLSLVQDRWFFSLPCSATPLGHFCFP